MKDAELSAHRGQKRSEGAEIYKTIQNKTHPFPFEQLHHSTCRWISCSYKNHRLSFRIRFCSLQFTPAIRPSLQTIAIGLVAFGENYKRHQSGIGQHHLIFSGTLSSSSHIILIHGPHSFILTSFLHSSLAPHYVPFWCCVFWIVDALSSFALQGWLLCFLHISECFEHAHTFNCRVGERKRCTIMYTVYTVVLHTQIFYKEKTLLLLWFCLVLCAASQWTQEVLHLMVSVSEPQLLHCRKAF